MRWPFRREPGDAGAVVAEFAVALPAVVLVLATCLATLRIGVEQLRLGDAAAAAARVVGGGEPEAAAHDVVRALSSGEIVSIAREPPLVCVTATTSIRIGFLNLPPLHERACALTDAA